MKQLTLFVLIILTFSSTRSDYTDPHWRAGRSAMVHLMDWKFADVANECETFLAPNGFAGVQVSPVNEHNIFDDQRSWMERYGPVSYNLTTRSGNVAGFADMTRRCNAVGVRIYVDVVFNHMTGSGFLGSGGNTADPVNRNYPAVPYTNEHFNPKCDITDWTNVNQIRNCELFGLPDLNQGHEHVRTQVAAFLNHLIDLGVAGFRVDIMKHMWPHDVQAIWSRLKTLNVNHGFAANSKPFVVGEVSDGYDLQRHGFLASEYFHLGTVTEFRYSEEISRVFSGRDLLKWLQSFGEGWSFWPSKYALTFVDNHDNQREPAKQILNYKDGRLYKMATAFHMAWPYGVPRIMSSFYFTTYEQGPPRDAAGNIVGPSFDANGQCTVASGWVCEHRWHQIKEMVKFRNVVHGTAVLNWWDNDSNQIAFSRGNRGFIAFNGQYGVNLSATLQTGLPAGTYCDIATGTKVGNTCTGGTVTVGSDGRAAIFLSAHVPEGFIAIHVDSRL
ncbi:alpha-amylase A-like [Chironomus tepperi]|uniref:alpha-amylase A-like n=1 Tax=Chironomus tepperi TaxID=113505 RepID=UPI00391EF3BD